MYVGKSDVIKVDTSKMEMDGSNLINLESSDVKWEWTLNGNPAQWLPDKRPCIG